MKIFFGVQSEGNGHITQAIAVKQFLNSKGHLVSGAFAGRKKKGLSKYFTDEFDVTQYDGFDFIFDARGKVIIWKTMIQNILRAPKLISSFIQICNIIRKEKPDMIINYYEPLVGLTALLFPNIKYISIGHQYAMTLPTYGNTSGFPVQKLFLSILNYVTSINATKVALSYYKFEDNTVVVCPPILRNDSYIHGDRQEDFILVYLMEEGMLDVLIAQAKTHPDIKIECFTKLTKEITDCPVNLSVRGLDGILFQERMRVCKSVVCSGGFETSSEAIYQNKPLFMVPMPNHYEQFANCSDALSHGFAMFSDKIDLDKIPKTQKGNTYWFNQYKRILSDVIDI